jgi:hypothetical protein
VIFRALNILKSELSRHLATHLKDGETVTLGNIAMLENQGPPGNGNNSNLEGKVVITLVGLRQEETLRNLPHYKVSNGETIYKNPPVHLNLFVLITANSGSYETSLKYLSQIIKCFQAKNTFSHLDSFEQLNDPDINQKDLGPFRLLVDLYSPSFEEANYLWSTLGGKQLPAACYKIRVLALEQDIPQAVGGTVKEIHIREK